MGTKLLLVDDGQRRARLGRRHHLARSDRAADPVAVAAGLVGLHATDPATVFLSARARLRRRETTVSALEAALYVDRTLARILCMRRTMFVVPLDVVPVVQAAVTDALVPGERRRTLQMLEELRKIEEGSVPDDCAAWLEQLEAATLAEITARGEATGAELGRAVPGLSLQIPVGEGTTWAGTIGMTTRVLFLLSTGQRIVRGRPKGSWTSSQYRWSPIEAWLPGGVPTLEPPAARAELARRYLARFGPARASDLKWWTGWTVADTKTALAAAGAVEVALAEGSGWILAGDQAPVRRPGHWVALLPSLDPTTMGWQRRDWYLADHGPQLFDRNGNAGPTIWVDGRIVGGWAQRRTGEVVHRLLEDVGAETAAAVCAEAAGLEAWLGPVRVTPRFPTPLQKLLIA